MNIRFFNITNTKPPVFCANQKTTSTNNLHALQTDTIELSAKNNPELKPKIELTEAEKEFNEVLIKYNRASQNAKIQKNLLKQYYSAQDKYDYQELLKEKRNLLSQLKRIAKKANTDYVTMEINIIEKKDYNRYAPKILRAKSIEELKEVQKLVDTPDIFVNIRKLLMELIMQRSKELSV